MSSTDISKRIESLLKSLSPQKAWSAISSNILSPNIPFEEHLRLFSLCYPDWEKNPESAVIWQPNSNTISNSALHKMMLDVHTDTLSAFHDLSVNKPEIFWATVLTRLGIQFQTYPHQIVDLSAGTEFPAWLPGARFNISESCFNANPESIAIIQKIDGRPIEKFSYAQLEKMTSRIAAGLIHAGCLPGDSIGLMMPMHIESIAAFLAIIRIGAICVPVAESFSCLEIAKRLTITQVKIIFTQDSFFRSNKIIPLYQKIIDADAPPAVVFSENLTDLRPQDTAWNSFLIDETGTIAFHPCEANTRCVVLFSSGTTGTPKAIPWTHATPIKSASDAFLHHNISNGDIVSWPTSLGWMMGPWLIFATFINRATLALYSDSPQDASFAQFVESAGVTVLGVVPTLVAHWRENDIARTSNWQGIRLFSSTGECSNPIDMLYLSSSAGYKPILEYCGGTEIGGAYITATLIEDNCLSVFTTPAMGSSFILMDESGHACNTGEVALRVPSMGLSLELLNADHHAIYFEGMPTDSGGNTLRRHGDYLCQLQSGHYRMLGRFDDTMNLGGIKVSSAEIERAMAHCPHVIETAAIAISDRSGPSRLIVHAITRDNLDVRTLKKSLQQAINTHLNPLFRIHQVVMTDTLPKTISGKIMRRLLRK